MLPTSGLVPGLLLDLCSTTSGLLLRFSGTSGDFGLLISDKGSEEDCSTPVLDVDLGGDKFTFSVGPLG